MSIDRAALRAQLAGRTAQSYNTKDSEGGFRTYVRSIHDRPIFKKFPEGSIMLDLIPFVVSADFMVDLEYPGKPRYRAGKPEYYLEVYSHMNIGPNNWNICCPSKNFGLPCPICEEYGRLQAAGADWETVLKPLKLNRRCVYAVWMHDVPALKEEAKGIQILEIAHFSMEASIMPLARDPRTGAMIEISDPDEGRTVYFERKGIKKDNTKYLGFQLLTRDPIPDEILAQAPPLNEAIEVLDYEQIKSLFYGGTGQTVDTEEAAPTRAPRQAPMSTPAAASAAAVPAAPAAPAAAAAPRRQPTPSAAAPAPASAAAAPAAPASAAPAPASAAAVSPRRPAPAAAAPAAAPAAPAAAAPADDNACPHGGTFGQDTDKIEQCNACELYDACGAAFDAAS